MTDSLLADSVEQFLSGRCGLSRVREIEADESGAAASDLWRDVIDSGFTDALVPEGRGGAGLALAEAGAIAFACGRHALPVPLSLTMMVRAALADAGQSAPAGAITIATAAKPFGVDGIVCAAVPYGLTADWVLVGIGSMQRLLPVAAAARSRAAGRASLSADLRWSELPESAVQAAPAADWRATGAAVIAAQMAGAMDRLSEMTIAYANERSQFDKPIGKLQAIQQQLSVMAEHSCAARTAAMIGLSGSTWRVETLHAAVAKTRAGEAAAVVAAISHAVHGAIGVTEEYDLQMFTRRLHEWRGHYGGETWWNRRLGEALLADTAPPLQYIQDRLAANAAARE